MICVFDKQTYAYDVKANEWRATGVETPDVREMIAFDTRHKVFLATAAMGRHMWAFRYGVTP